MLVVLDELGDLHEVEGRGGVLNGYRTLFSPHLTYTHLNYNPRCHYCPIIHYYYKQIKINIALFSSSGCAMTPSAEIRAL